MESYVGDDGIRRCGVCNGFLKERARKCPKCTRRAIAEEEAREAAARLAEQEAEKERESRARHRARRSALAAYVANVLARRGAERIEYMDSVPLDLP